MSEADDVRWLAQKIVAKAFHSVSDAAVEAMARRVLELEAVLEVVREVGVDFCPRADGEGWAVSNTRGLILEAARARLEEDVAFEASKEREACAKVCDDFGWDATRTREGTTDWVCRRLAEAIRARGAK